MMRSVGVHEVFASPKPRRGSHQAADRMGSGSRYEANNKSVLSIYRGAKSLEIYTHTVRASVGTPVTSPPDVLWAGRLIFNDDAKYPESSSWDRRVVLLAGRK